MELDGASRLLDEITLLLNNEDLGKVFYERLVQKSRIKLVDLENFENNTLNLVTELTYKKDKEELRLDNILLINEISLEIIEVKSRTTRKGRSKREKRIWFYSILNNSLQNHINCLLITRV